MSNDLTDKFPPTIFGSRRGKKCDNSFCYTIDKIHITMNYDLYHDIMCYDVDIDDKKIINHHVYTGLENLKTKLIQLVSEYVVMHSKLNILLMNSDKNDKKITLPDEFLKCQCIAKPYVIPDCLRDKERNTYKAYGFNTLTIILQLCDCDSIVKLHYLAGDGDFKSGNIYGYTKIEDCETDARFYLKSFISQKQKDIERFTNLIINVEKVLIGAS